MRRNCCISVICIFRSALPRKKFEGYEPQRRVLTEAQAQEKLKKRLSAYVNDKKKKGIKVIKTNIKYERQGNDYIAKGTIDVEEPVGKIRNIKSLTKKQVEKLPRQRLLRSNSVCCHMTKNVGKNRRQMVNYY